MLQLLSEVPYRFVPTQLGGCELWLDASRLAGLADADPVGSWPDLSGNGRDATQGTAARRPTYRVGVVNGRPVVRFDGVDDLMATAGFALNQPTTVLLVADLSNFANPKYVMDGAAQDRMALLHIGGKLTMYAGTAWGPQSATFSGWAVWQFEYNGADSRMYRNNGLVQVADAGAGNAGGLTLANRPAGDQAARIDVAEVAIYNRIPTAAERGRLHGYLGRKYGIGVT